MSLISLLHSYITPELVQKVSGVMGESQLHTQRAVDSVIPAIVGGFVSKANNLDETSRLYEMSHDGSYDFSLLSNLKATFSGGNEMTSLLSLGAPLLSYLVGGENKAATLAGNIAQTSGVKADSASSLLALIAPVAMAAIEKVRMNRGLNAAGLMAYLLGEKEEVMKAVPANTTNLLGIGAVSSTANAGSETANDKSASGVNWLYPVLGMLVFGALIWKLGGKDYSITPSATANVAPTSPAKLQQAPLSHEDSLRLDSAKKAMMAKMQESPEVKKSLSSGVELNFKAGSIEDKLLAFIENKNAVVNKDTWFDFDNLLFDTGKATLQASASTQLNNVGEILKAFPEVNIKIGGYTDNVGEEQKNQKLSTDRANTVKSELEKMGIKAERLAAEGYGSQHAVASNDTEEGRAKNRRISVRVTKK